MRRVFRGAVERLTQWYRGMSIQMVLSLSFTAVALIGIAFLGSSILLRFSDSTGKLTEESTQRLLAQVNLNLDSYLRRMMRVSDAVYYRVIKKNDIADGAMLDAMGLLYEENRDSLVSIAVFNEGGGIEAAVPLTAGRSDTFPRESAWFRLALAKMENLHFSTPHIQELFDDPDYRTRWVVSLSRHVQLTRGGRTERGVLLVDMSFGGIAQVCQNVDLPNGGYVYLIDRSGELIYHPRQQLIYSGLLEENNLTAAAYADGSHQEVFQGQRREVTVKTVGYTGWKLVGVTPNPPLLGEGDYLLLFAIAMLLFSAFLMAFLNFRISAYISDPILRLDQAVKELEAGSETVEIGESGCDEVRRLGRSIASMVSTMRHLMADIAVQEGEKRRNELEVLQSQINPHFLYNTLDSVIWMTESGRTQEAIQMVTSLARFFRISLSGGRRIIPLSDELEHARHYLSIQEIRYRNRFTFRIAAGEGTEGLYTLKLTLQPLLENAIYHGMAGVEDDGEIVVEARREGEDLVIDVSDNGVGIPPAVLEGLLTDRRGRADGSGIGVRNVHQRLRLTFGEPYGLTIFSESDEGTTVRVRLPVLGAEEAARWEEDRP